MNFRLSLLLCCAILTGFATAAQNKNQRNSDITFNDDSEIEGSGHDGEVTQDLESSGSGYGPDDEDTPIEPNNRPDGKLSPPPKTPPVIPEISQINIDTPRIIVDEATEKEQPAVKSQDSGDVKMDPNPESRQPSFLTQPGILAAMIGGAVVGLLCAILVVMFIVYRMRKKDEGSYSLGEPKPSPNANAYNRGNEKEFYA